MGLKQKVSDILINKKELIKRKYSAYTESDAGQRAGKVGKTAYLLKLNFGYYVLRDRSEEIKLPKGKCVLPLCESSIPSVSATELARSLAEYDIISFDVFDTLIYRYLSKPADVFYFVGEKLGVADYRRIRTEAEALARKEKHSLSGTYEVNIEEIADKVCEATGLSRDEIISEELIAEKSFCYANPYMKKVWEELLKSSKKPMILSDMYLPEEYMRELLTACGYDVSESEIIVSCDILKSKAEGSVYRLLKEMKREAKSFAHIGDNEHSDIKNAQKHGITAFRCVNPDKKGNIYRTEEMTPLIRTVWAGLVNKKMYGNEEAYDKYFCFGYNCLGILLYGFCSFINGLSEKHGTDKISFCGEQKEIIKAVYDNLYKDNKTEISDNESVREGYISAYCGSDEMLCRRKEESFYYLCKSDIRLSEIGGKAGISDGATAFATDYDMIKKKYGYLGEIDVKDAVAPLKYALCDKNYFKHLLSE